MPPALRLEDGLHGLYATLSLGQPLLPWLVWIGAAAGLLTLAGPAARPRQSPRVPPAPQSRRFAASLLTGAALPAILGAGFATRAADLLPDVNGT